MTFGSRTFLGAPYPKEEITYRNSIGMMGNMVRINALVSHVIGLTNGAAVSSDDFGVPLVYRRCLVDRSCSLAQQAAMRQAEQSRRIALESSAIRLAEVSVTYTMPRAMARRVFRTHTMSVTAAGRNLGLWTSYAGKDPNVDTSGSLGEVIADNGSGVPQPRMWTVRLNLGM